MGAKGRFSRDHPIVAQLLKTRLTLRKYAELDTKTKTEIERASKLAMEEHRERIAMEESDLSELDDILEPHLDPIPLLLSRKVHLIQARREEQVSSASKPLNTARGNPSSSIKDMFRLPMKPKRPDLLEDPSLNPFKPNKKQGFEIMNEAQRVQESMTRRRPGGDVQVDFRVRKKQRTEALEEPSASSTPEQPELLNSKEKKKKLKRQEKQVANLPLPPMEVEGKRQASQHILINRGLVRSRKKTAGNARVSNRNKYEKALKRRKGAVVDMRHGTSDGTYAGEETGVRGNLKKSKALT